MPPSAWDETFDVGVRSHYVAAVLAAPLLVEAPSGLIVNISSPGAVRYMHNAVYGVAKAALDRLTADLAHDLRHTKVTTTSLWPAIVRTELLELVPLDADGRRIVHIPGEGPVDVDRAGSPRLVGRAVAALVTDPDVSQWDGRSVTVNDLANRYGFEDPLTATTSRDRPGASGTR